MRSCASTGTRARPPSGLARLVFESIYTDDIPTTFTGGTRISARVVLNASVSTNLTRISALKRWLPFQDVVLSVGGTNLTDASVRDAVTRLVGAVLAEQHDDWVEGRRYFSLDVLAQARARGATEPPALPAPTLDTDLEPAA